MNAIYDELSSCALPFPHFLATHREVWRLVFTNYIFELWDIVGIGDIPNVFGQRIPRLGSQFSWRSGSCNGFFVGRRDFNRRVSSSSAKSTIMTRYGGGKRKNTNETKAPV